MNDILTNGTEIKQRIILEIQKANQNIFLAMAWFTDRDIASAFIDAKNRSVNVEIILSSNAQNETVKQMFRETNINLHAFETGDERGMMHHKFCLIDNKITINGSYNYSYNASNNNVENIQISDDSNTYRQFLSEFERLKYNIDHQLDVNAVNQNSLKMQTAQPINTENSFSQQLSNLIYATANINTDEYRKQGKENSRESAGNIEIFNSNYGNIKDRIKMYATDEGLGSKKNIMLSNINSAFESKKSEIETDKRNEINTINNNNDLEVRQINEKMIDIKKEKAILESGNQNTGEKGLLQINNEIEKNKLERRSLESTLVVSKFWTVGTILAIAGLCVFIYYLSVFFASAMYKVFFEGNIIRNSMQAGIDPGLPQLVDANAIVKIFKKEGLLFGIMAGLFFLIPMLLSNIKLLGSKIRWVNIVCFLIGILVFDVLVSGMVAINTDEIKSLLVGKQSTLQVWEVVKQGEFWLIFVFGMLPLIIAHFIIEFVATAYQKSQPEIVDAEKSRQINVLDRAMLDLNTEKETTTFKIKEKEDSLRIATEQIQQLERDLNSQQNLIESRSVALLKNIMVIYDDFIARITSGKIFTDEILDSVTSAYKSGYIDYLPELYADKEVANRVRLIEQVITNNRLN